MTDILSRLTEQGWQGWTVVASAALGVWFVAGLFVSLLWIGVAEWNAYLHRRDGRRQTRKALVTLEAWKARSDDEDSVLYRDYDIPGGFKTEAELRRIESDRVQFPGEAV